MFILFAALGSREKGFKMRFEGKNNFLRERNVFFKDCFVLDTCSMKTGLCIFMLRDILERQNIVYGVVVSLSFLFISIHH